MLRLIHVIFQCWIWLTLSLSFTYAQKQANIWYFGDGQGIDFNYQIPKAISDSFTESLPQWVPSTICDSTGKELLFSNGLKIRNGKTNQKSALPGLFDISNHVGNFNNYIVQNPSNSDEYFVFCSGVYNDNNPQMTLKGSSRYQSVRFVGINKDTLIQSTPVQEFLDKESFIAAYKTSNNNFYWVTIYAPITGRLYIHKLTENGLAIATHAYWIDTTGLNPQQITGTYDWNGLTFSSDGSQLAIATGYGTTNSVTLCDFNLNNGTISGIRKIANAWGVFMEFSYSGEFLYTSQSNNRGNVYQCQTHFTQSINLTDSIHVHLIAQKTNFFSALIGPDRKIYLRAVDGSRQVGIIDIPDLEGMACGLDSIGITLNAFSASGGAEMPRYVLSSAFLPKIWSSGFCFGDSTRLQLFNLEADSIILDWGDGTYENSLQKEYSHMYLTQDSFKIVYIYFRNGVRDTFEHAVSIRKLKDIDFGNDSLICSGSSLVLNMYDPDAEKYQWNTNAKDSAITVSQDGLYSVTVSNGQCVRTDSIEVFSIACAIAVQKTCIGDTTEISLINSVFDSVMVDFGDGNNITSSDSIYYHSYQDSGTYTATIRFYKGGLSREIIELIRIDKLPNLNLGTDTILCSNDPHQYDIKNPGFDSYQWSNGNNTPYFTPDSSQKFWVSATKNGCSTSDTAKVYIINCQIQKDSLCLNSPSKLSISEPSLDSIIWDFGDGNIGYGSEVRNQYASSGTFTGSLKVSIDNLSKILSFTVDIEEIPKPFMDSSLTLCYGQALELPFSFEKYQIDWSEGTQGIELFPGSSGTYSIRIQSANCQVNDSNQLLLQDCTCDNYTPTGFSPNKDGLNEIFIPIVSCDVSTLQFWIYNRWGQNIFESESLTEGWDGTYLEHPCEPGVYMYYCKYFNPLTNTSETIKGSIHLIR